MLNVTSVLNKLDIRTTCVPAAIMDVGAILESSYDGRRAASKLFDDILSLQISFADIIEARIYSKYMIEQVLNHNCEIDDVVKLLEVTRERAERFLTDPKNSHIFAKSEDEVEVEKVAVVSGVDVKVEVLASGKIKRGGKQVLAYELYKQLVLESDQSLNNQQFIAVLIKELSMTKAGATTYVANLKKEYGAPIGFSLKKGKNKG